METTNIEDRIVMPELTSIKTFYGLTKPSEAIRVMIQALRESDKLKDFRVEMSTFGSIDYVPDKVTKDGVEWVGKKEICIGCAATCTLMKLTGKQLIPEVMVTAYHRAMYLAGLADNYEAAEEKLEDISDAENAMYNELAVPIQEVLNFESAIDGARQGTFISLFHFFYGDGVFSDYPHLKTYLLHLAMDAVVIRNHNYDKPDVHEKYLKSADELEKHGY